MDSLEITSKMPLRNISTNFIFGWSNCTENDTTNCTDFMMPGYGDSNSFMKAVQSFLYIKVLIVIVLVGLLGNFMSIYLIVADKQMRSLSSSIYLVSVLSSDTGTLMSLFLVWLETLGFPVNHLPLVCKISVYLTYVCGFLSIWYIVCITVETFITICHPTKIKQMCTLFRARVVALVLLFTALMLYVISLVITEVQPTYYEQINATIDQCSIRTGFNTLSNIVSYTDTVLTLILPFIILIVLLTFITLAIIRSIQRKKRRTIKKPSQNGSTSNSGGGGGSKLPQVRVAKMLFILSCSVVILSAPSHIIRLRSMFMSIQIMTEMEGFIHLVFLFISYCSYSVKFFICVACSQNFRKLFVNKFCFLRQKTYHNVPTNTMETTT